MKKIFLFFAVAFISCSGKKDICKEKMIAPIPSIVNNVSDYEKDKKQVKECYINNVEYYRKHVDKIENSTTFTPYGEYYVNDSLGYQKLPSATNQNIEVKVDEIYYSPDKLKAIIFIGLKHIEQRNENRKYDALCLVGLRKNILSNFILYPLSMFSQIGYPNFEDPLYVIKSRYFNCLSRTQDMWGKDFRTNLGDKDFWNNNLLFDMVTTTEDFKYHKSNFKSGEKLYYFQTYSVSDMDGKHWNNHFKHDVLNCN